MNGIAVHPSQARLGALRAALSADGLDGLLVPRTDAHLGSGPPAADRLGWLSGFTGSAGLALVLPDRACLFADGRYLLQARDQTDRALWQVRHLHRVSPADWVAEAGAGRGGALRIGYDPRLLAEPTLDALSAGGIEPVPACSPIDRLWQDRPPMPDGPLSLHPEALAGRPARNKRAMIAAILRGAGQDCTVLADPTQIAWLLNLRGSDLPFTPVALCFALLHDDGRAALFVEPRRVPDAVSAVLGSEVAILPPDALPDALAALRGRRVRVDPVRVPVWFLHRLEEAGAILARAPDPCLLPRARKTEAERRAMRAAHRADSLAVCRFLFWLERHGARHDEHQAAERILALRLHGGDCTGASFPAISASGPSAALMHYHPTAAGARPIARDAFFLLDSGGQYPGATTDVTRTVWMGAAPPPTPLATQFTLVLQGHIALADAVFPDGTQGHRLDMLARLPLWRAGMEFDHGAGHGLGSFLGVHEWPLAFSPTPSDGPVHEGMVLTNEPGHYVPGSHGIRTENAMEAVRTPMAGFLRFEPLTLAPIDRCAILPALLADVERSWIDRYHARVRDTLCPALEPDCADWLAQSCRPLDPA